MIKNYEDFERTLAEDAPRDKWPEALKALWYAANGNWEASHDIAQEMHSALGSWIHAYLHRQEGDDFNSGYWYRKAGRKVCLSTLEEELRDITEYVLAPL